MRIFGGIFEHTTSPTIYPDLELAAVVDNVEGIAQSASAPFALEFLVRDAARVRPQRNGASGVNGNVRAAGQFLASVSCGMSNRPWARYCRRRGRTDV